MDQHPYSFTNNRETENLLSVIVKQRYQKFDLIAYDLAAHLFMHVHPNIRGIGGKNDSQNSSKHLLKVIIAIVFFTPF